MEDHVGKSLDEVKGYLDALKLDLQINEVEEFSDDYKEGQIIRTDPSAEERLSTGGVVILYVSKGPEVIELEMEDLSKKTVDEAKKWLDKQNLDLTVEVEEEENLEVDEGTILRTKPAAGEKVKTGDTVIIYVAKGLKTDYMPSVTGMTVEKALKELDQLKTDLSLTIEEVEEYSDDVEKGKIIRSEPAYNEAVRTGSTVKLYVSGSKKAKMPNVVGKDLQSALDLLEYAGFTNIKHDKYVDSNQTKDTVVTQSVAKDQEVSVDTEIVLELSKGGAQVPKDHTFGLIEGMTSNYKVEIVEKDSGKTVYSGTVSADESAVTVSLIGSGKVTYLVYINDTYFGDYGDVTVDFDKP